MMRILRRNIVLTMVVGLLALGTSGLAIAGGMHGEKASHEMALTGCLERDMNDGYTLVERESGDSITVEGTEDVKLESYVGHSVKVTGTWIETQSEYSRFFRVSKIENLSDSCQP